MYQDYDSDSDVPEELKQDYVDEQTGDVPLKRSVLSHIFLRPLWETRSSGRSPRRLTQVSVRSAPGYSIQRMLVNHACKEK